MPDPLDTEAEILAALMYILDRSLLVDVTGVPLDLDDQRRVISIAHRALLRIPLPAREVVDDRPVPAWLAALPDPRQES